MSAPARRRWVTSTPSDELCKGQDVRSSAAGHCTGQPWHPLWGHTLARLRSTRLSRRLPLLRSITPNFQPRKPTARPDTARGRRLPSTSPENAQEVTRIKPERVTKTSRALATVAAFAFLTTTHNTNTLRASTRDYGTDPPPRQFMERPATHTVLRHNPARDAAVPQCGRQPRPAHHTLICCRE